MRALIVDDERHARDELALLLKAFPAVVVVGQASDAREARERIAALDPDIVFLDIQMPEETGFELLASLGDSAPRVIFTTAYDAHALQAFEFGAVDYLMKPVTPKRLALALGRLGATGGEAEPFEPSFTDLSAKPLGVNDRVMIVNSDGISYVNVSSIIGAESLGGYSKVWLEGSSPVIRRSLSNLEARLPGEIFIRANRSQLINLQCVQSIEPWFSGGLRLGMRGGITVELSRRQAKMFRERGSL